MTHLFQNGGSGIFGTEIILSLQLPKICLKSNHFHLCYHVTQMFRKLTPENHGWILKLERTLNVSVFPQKV